MPDHIIIIEDYDTIAVITGTDGATIRFSDKLDLTMSRETLEHFLYKLRKAEKRHHIQQAKPAMLGNNFAWNTKDIQRLKELVEGGLGPETIAKVLNKSLTSIWNRTRRLGYKRQPNYSWISPGK